MLLSQPNTADLHGTDLLESEKERQTNRYVKDVLQKYQDVPFKMFWIISATVRGGASGRDRALGLLRVQIFSLWPKFTNFIRGLH